MSDLLDRVHIAARLRQYSERTERTYVSWIRRFILFHDRRHPARMDAGHVKAFLQHLAVDREVAASTQNQALAALLFLYRDVLQQPLEELDSLPRAPRSRHIPVVLSRSEVRKLLHQLTGPAHLVGLLLYGSGLRLLECLHLRTKDLDLDYMQLEIRNAKGNRDRRSVLPSSALPHLRRQLHLARERHAKDQAHGVRVKLPRAFDRKSPSAPTDFRWYWLFPATRTYLDRSDGRRYRHH